MGLPILELDDIRIASPCTMRWEDMTGGDRVRFCAACQKNVFNLSDMKRGEALDLMRSTEGRVCARFYRRKDGTILTADCPVGLRLAARRAKRAILGATLSALGALGAVLALLAQTPARRVVDVEGMRRGVALTTHHVEEKHDKLIVPEPPHDSVAGGAAISDVRGQVMMGDVDVVQARQ